jgi:multisubunit Na+/H+ antiporter MnhE subunit
MLRAIAMALGLSLFWLVLSQPQNSVWSWSAMGAAVLGCIVCAGRFGGITDTYLRAPRLIVAHARRSAGVLEGVLSIVRAASASVFPGAPTLLRLRVQARDPGRRASFASLLNATPGLLVVDADDSGLLLHAFDEEKADASLLTRAEQEMGGAL